MHTQRFRSGVRVVFSFLAILLFLGGCFNPIAPAPDDEEPEGNPPSPSSDANLTSLAMAPDPFGELSFSAETTSYAVNVPNSVESVAVTATASNAEASVALTADGAVVSQGADIPLEIGETDVTVEVTAGDGTVKAYTLQIARAAADSSDSSLASLVVGMEVVALTGPGGYDLNFENSVASVLITPTASDSQASITVAVDEGTAEATDSGDAFGPVPITVGETIVEIVVTADNDTTSEYTLSITREASGPFVITGEIAGLLDYLSGSVDESYDPSGSDVVAFDEEDTELARDEIESRAFSLVLPPIEASSLFPITDDLPDGLTVSDSEANIQLATLEIDDSLGTELFYGTYASSFDDEIVTINQTLEQYLYADRPVTVTGEVTEDGGDFTYDLELAQGWNRVRFAIETEVSIVTEEGSGGGSVTTEPMPDEAQWYAATLGGILEEGILVLFDSIKEEYEEYWIQAVLVAEETSPADEENWIAATTPSPFSSGSAAALFYDVSTEEPFFGEEETAYELYARLVDDPDAVEKTVNLTSSDGGPLATITGGVSAILEVSLSDATYTEM